MKPAKLDLPTIWRGCDWGPVTMKWKDQDGHPINLAGFQPKASSLNVDLHPRITDAAGGVTEMMLDRNETSSMKLGVESWDWIWEAVTGDYRFPPFLAGKLPIMEPQTPTRSIPIGPPPSNDLFANATLLDGDDGSIAGSVVNATREAGEPAGDSSVWYNWTPKVGRTLSMSIAGDWLNIYVYTGSSVNALTLVAASSGNPSTVSWITDDPMEVLYRIRVFKRTRTSAFNLVWNTSLP